MAINNYIYCDEDEYPLNITPQVSKVSIINSESSDILTYQADCYINIKEYRFQLTAQQIIDSIVRLRKYVKTREINIVISSKGISIFAQHEK